MFGDPFLHLFKDVDFPYINQLQVSIFDTLKVVLPTIPNVEIHYWEALRPGLQQMEERWFQ